MRKALLFFFLILTPAYAIDTQEIRNQAFDKADWINAIVRVSMRDKPTDNFLGERPGGSGTLTYHDSKRGYVLTNRHIVIDENRNHRYPYAVVKWLNGTKSLGKVHYVDSDADFAIIVVSVTPDMPYLSLARSAEYPVKGQKVWMCGYGGTSGRITRWKTNYLGKETQFLSSTDIASATNTISGDSGGALVHLSQNGWRQIGVHWGWRGFKQNRAHAVSAAYIRARTKQDTFPRRKHPNPPWEGTRPPEGTILPLPDELPTPPVSSPAIPPPPLAKAPIKGPVQIDPASVPLAIVATIDPLVLPIKVTPELLDWTEKDIEKLAKIVAIKVAGEVEIDYDLIVNKVKDQIEVPEAAYREKFVLVRGVGTSYWPRTRNFLRDARESFTPIDEVPPADVNYTGPLPVLVYYINGTPQTVYEGPKNVDDTLTLISRGDLP